MCQLRLANLIICVMYVGCGGSTLANPVVVNTGSADPPDGYQAALATTQADSYPIVVSDEPHSFLRVNAKSVPVGGPCAASTFDIKAWPGSVDIYLNPAPNCVLTQADTETLHREGLNLAWGISQRARMLAGGPLEESQRSNMYFGAPMNYHIQGAPPPP